MQRNRNPCRRQSKGECPHCENIPVRPSTDKQTVPHGGHQRNSHTLIPKGSDQILPDDILYFTTLRKHIDSLPELFGKKSFETRKIKFMGGSLNHHAYHTTNPDEHQYKIIEQDRERAEKASGDGPLPNVTVFVEDGRNAEFLLREGITDPMHFLPLPVTPKHILGCMMAKQYGVKEDGAEVENIDYISMAERFNIGTVINKKLIAASKDHTTVAESRCFQYIKILTIADAM
jgi:trk system potassium uptake protein TrkA